MATPSASPSDLKGLNLDPSVPLFAGIFAIFALFRGYAILAAPAAVQVEDARQAEVQRKAVASVERLKSNGFFLMVGCGLILTLMIWGVRVGDRIYSLPSPGSRDALLIWPWIGFLAFHGFRQLGFAHKIRERELRRAESVRPLALIRFQGACWLASGLALLALCVYAILR